MKNLASPIRCVLLLLALSTLIGCSTLSSTGSTHIDASAGVTLMMLENLSVTPQAGRKAAALIETRLRQQGVSRLAAVRPQTPLTLTGLMQRQDEHDTARLAAVANGHRYLLGGSVHEWRYKAAPDREAVVGMSLYLEDVESGEVLWRASAARSAWGGASLTDVADRVAATLLDEVNVSSHR